MRSAVEGLRHSLWEVTAPFPTAEPLTASVTTDVCIVGAGMAGLSTAYELVRQGKRVVVLDDGPIGGGETGRTTAHVATSFDDYYHEVERIHGEEAMRRLADSFRAAVDQIEAIVQAEQIDCDFTRLDGWWFAANDRDVELLQKEQDAARRAGFTDVSLEHEWPVPHLTAPAYLRFPRQAQFHPLKYLAGLARAIMARGGRIFTNAHVSTVVDAKLDGKDDQPCTVTTDTGYEITARDVVVATNSPINDMVTIHTKQYAYRTYVISARIARGAMPLALLWDTLEPYHYVRLYHGVGNGEGHADDLLIIGGEDHKTGQDDDETSRFSRLESWARSRFPITDVIARWSGQVMEPVDHVAFIGRNPGDRHIWVVTGDSGNGITHGAVAGLLLGELISGRSHPWEALYDPSRISLRTLPTWVSENANVAVQYADLVTPGEVRSVDEVPAGQGRIVRDGLRKLAVYRSEAGDVQIRSAICTHLGCVVDWNAAESSWDCPCHGSRFAIDGTVLNGPAVTPLAEADEPA